MVSTYVCIYCEVWLMLMSSLFSVSGVQDPPIPPSISKCLQELKATKLNHSQQNAINSMLDPACQQV